MNILDPSLDMVYGNKPAQSKVLGMNSVKKEVTQYMQILKETISMVHFLNRCATEILYRQ